MKKCLLVAMLAAYSISLPALASNIHDQKPGTLVLQQKSPQPQVKKPVVLTKKVSAAPVAKKSAQNNNPYKLKK